MRAVLIGATGLIGSHLLELLLEDGYFDQVRILVRRPMERVHPKLEICLVNFSDPGSLRRALQNSDVIFCTIGTTQKKVKGDRDAYRKVDYDIAVDAARLGKQSGCKHFVLVSAVGANDRSRNFYLKLKGEIEQAVTNTGIRSVHIMRPSVLLGNRKEFRLGEKLATWLMPVISFLLPRRMRPVRAYDVARAMISASKNVDEGRYYYHYAEIRACSI